MRAAREQKSASPRCYTQLKVSESLLRPPIPDRHTPQQEARVFFLFFLEKKHPLTLPPWTGAA